MQRLWSVCGDRRTTDVAGNGSAAPVVLLGYLALEQKPPPDEGQQLVGVEAACGLRQASLRDLCCATIKTGHPATICHTSDGGAVSGGQADVKPEAARGGGPQGRGFQQVCVAAFQIT